MVRLLCLLTFPGGRFASRLAYGGLLAPPCPHRKLLKKLEQNFYVLPAVGWALVPDPDRAINQYRRQ